MVTSSPRRLWPRFTLRVLLVVVTLLCIGLAMWTHRAREQQRLVERIERSGGNIVYDFDELSADFETVTLGTSIVPGPVLDLFGKDYFHSVTHVTLRDVRMLPDLQYLPRLISVCIWDRSIRDGDLAPLACFRGLRALDISSGPGLAATTQIGDQSLVVIAGLPKLEVTTVEGSYITAEGLSALAHSPSLRVVEVGCDNSSVDWHAADAFRLSGRVSRLRIVNGPVDKTRRIVAEWGE